jgi:hypothetical protein
MGTLWQDIRYAGRMLRKSPVFTVVVTLSLAIGIGANAVVFTWIQAVLLDATEGMADPTRLVVVCPRHRTAGLDETMSFPDIRSLVEQKNVFAGITASQMGAATLQVGDTMEWVWSQFTLANFFDVLGVMPIAGRGFRSGEDQPGTGGLVAVISHGLWQRRFGGDPSVVGRVVQINRRPVTIVGVAPAGFKGTMGALRFDLWAPLPVEMDATLLRERFEQRGSHWLHTMARLAPGVSRRQAPVAWSRNPPRPAVTSPSRSCRSGSAPGAARVSCCRCCGCWHWWLVCSWCSWRPMSPTSCSPARAGAGPSWRCVWPWAPPAGVSFDNCSRRALFSPSWEAFAALWAPCGA